MPYCRKCGAKLDDTARFCPVCGTQVITVTVPPAPPPPRQAMRPRRAGLPAYAIALIAILLGALVLGVIAFLPFLPVNFNQSNNAPIQSGAERLVLDFRADSARVNVIPQQLHGKAVVLNVTTTGNVGIFGNPNNPVNVTFVRDVSSLEATQIVTANVSQTSSLLFAGSVRVVCDLYVDPSVDIVLTVHVGTGEILLKTGTPVTFDSVFLQAGTGNVFVNISNGSLIAGPFSASTGTGDVQFQMDNVDVDGNVSVSLLSGTGSMNTFITQNRKLGGNVTLSATTGTGAVNLFMMLNNDAVAARIDSETSLGGISISVQNFAGNKSLTQSTNYPAASNFLVKQITSLGDIRIDANYEPSATPS